MGKNKKKNLIKDVFVTDDNKPYLNYSTEDEGEIDFASITGKGIKINEDNDYLSYKVTMFVTKDEAQLIRDTAQALWDEFKPHGAKDEPKNDLVYEHPETGKFIINPHARVENSDGSQAIIGLVDASDNPARLDPEVFGKIGKGSKGYVNVNFTTYNKGVSMYLNAVQLSEFVPYSGGGGDGSQNFKGRGGKSLAPQAGGEFKKKKDKKKKKKNKEK